MRRSSSTSPSLCLSHRTGAVQVRRLAESNTPALRSLYEPALDGPPAARAMLIRSGGEGSRYTQDDSAGARTEQVSVLPAALLRALAPHVGARVPAYTRDGGACVLRRVNTKRAGTQFLVRHLSRPAAGVEASRASLINGHGFH